MIFTFNINRLHRRDVKRSKSKLPVVIVDKEWSSSFCHFVVGEVDVYGLLFFCHYVEIPESTKVKDLHVRVTVTNTIKSAECA